MAKATVVSVGITPTLLGSTQQALLLQNLTAVIVYVGGSGVTAGVTATGGLQLPAATTGGTGGTPTAVPALAEAETADPGLYGIVATGTANVAVLSP